MLDPNKPHGHDKISIPMINISSTSICKPLRITFNHCIDSYIYIHLSGEKLYQYTKQPHITRLGFFIDQGLSSTNQSGFKSGDTCVNKLLSIMHDIYKLFDDGYEVRGVFFDISKAFDKVWCDGLIFKLQENRILGNLLRFLKHFLTSTKGLY